MTIRPEDFETKPKHTLVHWVVMIALVLGCVAIAAL